MSSTKLIYDYWRERYPASVFVPFAILLAGAGAAAGGSLPTVRDAIKSCILAYTLVLVFRIVDDLADLRSDRLRYPGRVLVRASSRTPIVVLALVIALGDVLMMMSQPRPGARIAVFAAISLFLGLWYHRRARLRAGPLAGAHILLLKYPAISLLTCASWDGLTLHTALPSLGAIYLGLCIYEQVHDRAVRESRGAPWIFAAELGLLAGLPLLALSTGGFLR
jgi:4-hydroxybenzoate polyprenyltransferase